MDILRARLNQTRVWRSINPTTEVLSTTCSAVAPTLITPDTLGSRKILNMAEQQQKERFAPKQAVELAPPKDDIITLDHLSKCDGGVIPSNYH